MPLRLRQKRLQIGTHWPALTGRGRPLADFTGVPQMRFAMIKILSVQASE